MSRLRCASYVASRDVAYFITTILWENDLTGRSWYESGIRDLHAPEKENFTLVQHDIYYRDGHRLMVALLKQGKTPSEIRAMEGRGLMRALRDLVEKPNPP